MQVELAYALECDESTPAGKLGRAVRTLMEDLYGHPQMIKESTAESLGQALRKLVALNAEGRNAQLGSEAALKDLLEGL
jgi:hypothetical protein